MTIKHYHTATGRRLFRGARPTHRGKLAAARPFRPGVAAPPSYCWIFPAKMNMQGNSQYGDCVSAEEAQNKCVGGIYIEEQTTVSWAQKNGDLNGANLEPVIQQMENAGMAQDDNVYGDGSALAVDFTDSPTMQSAIYQALLEGGQIKMGIAADQLPAGAGNANGWILVGASPDSNEDHCTGICGYGTIAEFAQAIQQVYGITVTIPSGLDPDTQGYAMYTWSTIGWLDVQSMIHISGEAWIRTPSTVIHGTGTPTPDQVTVVLPTPTPPPPPPPPPTPTPGPTPTPTPTGLCNRPIVLAMEAVLAYLTVLPLPLSPGLAVILADVTAALQVLCPSALARLSVRHR